MTISDQHPLTDKIIDTFASPQYDYFEGIGEINLGYDDDDLRAAADWQLEQVINWLNETILERGSSFEAVNIPEELEEVMRPTTTQEDN
jgi:hypothetical protein